MNRIGPTRLKILALILQGHDRGMPPTVRDLGRQVGRDVQSVYRHMLALEHAGLITWDRHTARTPRPTCFMIQEYS